MRLRYTRTAARQLDEVLAYIAARSPQGAGHVMDRIVSLIELVCEHPSSGTPTGKHEIRRVVASPYPYLIFYRAKADEIVIHAVRHASRRPRD